jgi:hypothetical protein
MQPNTREGLLFPALFNMPRASIDAPTFVDQFFLIDAPTFVDQFFLVNRSLSRHTFSCLRRQLEGSAVCRRRATGLVTECRAL